MTASRDEGRMTKNDIRPSSFVVRLKILPGILFLLAALACSYTSLGNQPLPTLVTSPSGTLPTRVIAVNTSTPTLTPTPTATATPTPLPAVRLERANRAMFNGDYDTALQEYNAILNGSASTDETRAAQLGAAKAKLRAGDDSAADALQAFTASFPGDPREAEAWFLLGQTRTSAGDYTGAVEAYRQYQKLRGDLIAPYVNQRIGDALRADVKPQAAAEAYRAALAAPSNITLDLREKLAGALLDANDAPGAMAQYDAILAVSKFLSYRSRIQTLAIQALDNAGQAKQAHQRRLSIVNEYAAVAADQLACPYYSNYAYDALVTLVGENVPVDEFKRGLVDYCARQYDPALAAFTRSIQAGNRVAESRYWAGLAFRAQGDTPNALRQFNLIVQDFSTSPVVGSAWMEKARTYVTTGDLTSAASAYREFAAQYPTHAEAPEALWRAGLAAYNFGDNKTALEAWQTLTAWQKRYNAYPVPEGSVAALIWQGKLALAQGQTVTATTFFSQAASVAPQSYYSLRAAEWLRGEAAPLRPISSTLTFDEPAQRAAAEAWLAARLNITDSTQLRVPRPGLAADPALQRGLELYKLGLQAEADNEFDAVLDTRQEPIERYQLAILFRDLGAYRQSIAAANTLVGLGGSSIADIPPFLARLVYPTYYADLVVPEAQARGLDPLLIFALVRQESLFESLSYSTAAAHGLMQIIPSTGQEIATALKWPDYSQSDLYKPYISVKFGVYYLARQRDGLDGDSYAGLAAYNGGPGNSARWKAASGDDPDSFYETITFSETRLYIRRISEYYFVYKKLYAAQ